MDLDAVESHGYSFQTDMTRLVVEAGGVIMEVPINFVERQVGQSKISGNIFWESLGRVTRWGIKKRGEQIKGLFKRPV
jgi:dolichol-phosphate mannosyltransferase